MPSFAAAVVLQFFFAVKLGWLPALGSGSGFLDGLRHLILPALALAASSVALVTRVTRTAVREELDREHVQTAVSRGLPRLDILRRHVLRNAAIPITTVVGITIASLIALAAIVETAFGLNGLGAYLVQAAQNKDFAVVQGISLVLVVAFVVTNMVVDIAYALLDPRVVLGSRPSEPRGAGPGSEGRDRGAPRADCPEARDAGLGEPHRRGPRRAPGGPRPAGATVRPEPVEPVLRQRRPLRRPPAGLRRSGPRSVEPPDGRGSHDGAGRRLRRPGRRRRRLGACGDDGLVRRPGRHRRLSRRWTSCSRSRASCWRCCRPRSSDRGCCPRGWPWRWPTRRTWPGSCAARR